MTTLRSAALCIALCLTPGVYAEGLDTPRSIDSMSHENSEFVLGMSIGDNWKDHARTFERIDRKLQGYIDFVQRGPLNKVNPQKKPVRIDFVLSHKPDAKARKFLEEKRTQLQKLNLRSRLQVPKDAREPYAS